MINLLPITYRKELAAARTNTLLRRYVILLAMVIAVLVVELGGVYVMLNIDQQRSKSIISENETKTARYAAIKTQATELRSNLATAKLIIDQQTDYIAILTGIAKILPDGATLNSLTINPSSFGTPTALTISTTTYGEAIEVKTRMQASSLFSDINFQSITNTGDSENGRQYSSTYNVTFAKGKL